jgi:4-amino-4-deoxy-L-arabinose transferase-like glycosyltransferase
MNSFLSAWTPSERRWLALLVLAVIVGFYLPLHAAPLFDVDEGAFSEATREMFVRGDFLSTYLNGAPRYDKPIFIYWLQALSVATFGLNEFALRLPSAVAATLWVWVVVAFTARLLDRSTALVAGLLTATALGVTLIGKAATADAWLNFFLAAAMLDLYRYYHERRPVFVYRVFLWMGFGFLTKGPVAVLIPFVVSFLFFAWQRELRAWAQAAFRPLGILLFCAIALPWYIVEYARDGGAFVQGFFMKHNIERFEAPMQGHGGNFLYYAGVTLLLVFPYTTFFVNVLARLKPALRTPLYRYLWLWFFFVFAFFTLSGTKLPHYLLYGTTPLFILMAAQRDALRHRWLALAPAVLVFAALLFLPEIVAAGTYANGYVRAMLQFPHEILNGGYRAQIALALVFVLLLAVWRRLPAWPALVGAGFASVMVFSLALLPAVAAFTQEPVREAALFAKHAGYPVVMWNMNMPSFSVYRERVTEQRAPRPGEIVITREPFLAQLPPYQLLYARRGVVLARVLPTSTTPTGS